MKRLNCLRVATLVAALVVGWLPLINNSILAQDTAPVIGSSNTVTADPPVDRPRTTPCVVQLFSGLEFVDFSVKNFQFVPPAACPGPWEKVVFTADFSVTAGRQFDRTALISLGNVNLYFGTTAEPRRALAPTWHVERDETDYSALFQSPQVGHAILGNVVDSTYTGIIRGSASLEFYPARRAHGNRDHHDRDHDAPRPADAVLPLTQSSDQGGINEPATLFGSTDQLATTFNLPRNIERAYLDLITQSQSRDEFWYSCVPNDLTTELQSCGNTSFREAQVSIDGQPAGVAPVYPWLYTGAVDPYLWQPIPAVQTLNFVPYRVDLTPFAGLLNDGLPHTIAVGVFNANSYFSATATLLLYLDHGSEQVTGAITANTLESDLTPSISEQIETDPAGNISGSVTTASSRQFKVAGFINTSHGRVETEVRQTIRFNNLQNFTIDASTYIQDISQQTEVDARTITRQGFASFETLRQFHYPLTLKIAVALAADGSTTQQTTMSQEFKQTVWSPFFTSHVENKMSSTDTLNFDPSGAFTGPSHGKASQQYRSFDTRRGAYTCSLTAENNALATVSKGCIGK